MKYQRRIKSELHQKPQCNYRKGDTHSEVDSGRVSHNSRNCLFSNEKRYGSITNQSAGGEHSSDLGASLIMVLKRDIRVRSKEELAREEPLDLNPERQTPPVSFVLLLLARDW